MKALKTPDETDVDKIAATFQVYLRLCQQLARALVIVTRECILKFLGPTFERRPPFVDAAQEAAQKRRFDAKDADDDEVR